MWEEENGLITHDIRIGRKPALRGEDDHGVISLRIRSGLITRLNHLAFETNRSRNEVISLLLESAVSIVRVEEKHK